MSAMTASSACRGKIDRVLVDAPCTGMGTLRRNPDLKWRQNLQAVDEMTVKQAAILQSAARLVKSGGRLVYATCSVLPQENEAIALAFSEANPDFAPLDVGEILTDLKVEQRCRPCAAAATMGSGSCVCGRIGIRPMVSLLPFGKRSDRLAS